jgi:hypothetical protein
MKERNHLEDPGVDGRIIHIKMDLQEGDGWHDCIDQAHDTDRWLAFVNAVMNLRIP